MADVDKVSRVLGLLGSLDDCDKGLTFGRIAKLTGLHPDTVKRIVLDIVAYQSFRRIRVLSGRGVSLVVGDDFDDVSLLDRVRALELRLDDSSRVVNSKLDKILKCFVRGV